MKTKLRIYLTKHGLTGRVFSQKLDITEGSLYNLLSMRHSPSLGLAFKIEEFTKGEVTARDFYKENERAAAKLSKARD